MIAPLMRCLTVVMLCASPCTSQVSAQTQPPHPAHTSRPIQVGGYATAGHINLASAQSFDAILGTSSGLIFGGGLRAGLPFGGLFLDAGAWRYAKRGERAFVLNGTVYSLNIPVEVTMTPLELSAGWRFRFRRLPRFVPYVAAGVTVMKYVERSDFSTPAEDVDEQFVGRLFVGGAEIRLMRWLGAGTEVVWSSVRNALGDAGVSRAFDETGLGGTSFRFKITAGR